MDTVQSKMYSIITMPKNYLNILPVPTCLLLGARDGFRMTPPHQAAGELGIFPLSSFNLTSSA